MNTTRLRELCDAVENGSARQEDVQELARLAREAANDAYRAASFSCNNFEDLENARKLEPEEQEDFDESRIIQIAYAPS